MKGKILFKEEQSFKNTWMFYIVIGISVLAVVGTIVPLMTTGNMEAILGLIIATVVCMGVVALFTFSKLTTIIDDQSIYYRYPPFITSEKRLGSSEVAEVFVRKYQPIWEYGGWGYRRSMRKGTALNVAGSVGLQIITQSGKKILIGTQRPEELEKALKKLKDNWNERHG